MPSTSSVSAIVLNCVKHGNGPLEVTCRFELTTDAVVPLGASHPHGVSEAQSVTARVELSLSVPATRLRWAEKLAPNCVGNIWSARAYDFAMLQYGFMSFGSRYEYG